MKISKREKKMISILSLVICAFLYYQFGYTTLNSKVADKTKERDSTKQKYETAIDTVNKMESQSSKVKILNAKINDESTPFYPFIGQDYIILDMDEFIKESGLQGAGMTFKEVEVNNVFQEKKSAKDIDLKESSIQSVVDEYSAKFKDNTNKDEQIIEKRVTAQGNNNAGTASTNTKDSAGNTVYQMQLTVDFDGTYAQVVKFLGLLRDNSKSKKMPAYTISMTTKNSTDVKGSVTMMIYAIPKLTPDNMTWTLNGSHGKVAPFTVDSPVTGSKPTSETGDFKVVVKSVDSVLPTVTIGRANDSLRNTCVYADSKIEAQAELTLNQEGDKYYYKYKTTDGSWPKDYSGKGNEFVPSEGNIRIDMTSEGRINSDDNAGLRLNIINNTDKFVEVDISGDDKSNPRIAIDGDSKNIIVNEK